MTRTHVSKYIEQNIARFQQIYTDCADIKMRRMKLGRNRKRTCFLAYIEVSVESVSLEQNAIGKLMSYLNELPEDAFTDALNENAMGLSDMQPFDTVEEAATAMLTGDAIFFVDGYERALKIPDRGYPGMSVSESDSEKVIRGSRESFTDSIKINSALIRKRVRATNVKVSEQILGQRSQTCVDLVYIEDLVRPELLDEIQKRLGSYEIDGILDGGVIEQLSEENWYSPFPQFLTTQRPDRAAMSILEGRVVVLTDNSPTALILPTDYNSFLKTTDDYYNRFEAASFARLLRYAASFLAMSLPGFYIAITNFHTQLLPTPLLISFWQARMGVPFPAAFEVILMELAFELLREAGVRLPGPMGNTIGIVGGLIVGQAAVEANLVSPIVVIVVAFTALCSFAIPNEEFAFAFRILKFLLILLCAWMGFFGFLVGLTLVLIHLSKLKSFGFLYLTPFAGADLNNYEDTKDALLRFPLRRLQKRPIYAQSRQRTKLFFKKNAAPGSRQ